MPRNRLVQRRHWILALSEALSMPSERPILLQDGLENYPDGKPLHPRSRIVIRPNRGRGTSRGRYTGQGQALRPRLQGPDNCCGPQAPTENLWGQIT